LAATYFKLNSTNRSGPSDFKSITVWAPCLLAIVLRQHEECIRFSYSNEDTYQGWRKKKGLGRRETTKCGAQCQARTCPVTTPQQIEASLGLYMLINVCPQRKHNSARIQKGIPQEKVVGLICYFGRLRHSTTLLPQIATSDLSHLSSSFDGFEYASPHSAHTPKSLPISLEAPTSNSFMAPQYHHSGAQDGTGYSQNMRRLQTSAPDEEVSYAFSAPQSVSSMSHNSPATPHTNFEMDYEDQKNLYPGYQSAAFTQAMQDVFPDQIYSSAPSYPAQVQPAMPRFNTHLSPHRSVFANRLQAANQDHLTAQTSSPVTSVPRGQSPFRQNSPFVEQARMNSQRPSQQMNTVPVSQAQEPTKSVSPKELMLDEHDIDDQSAPLFQDQSNSVFSNRRPSSNLSNFQSGLYNSHYSTLQIPQQYPFVGQNRQENSHQSMPDRTPDFPAHLAPMESTIEEGPSEPSSELQLRNHQSHSIQRPEDTSSDAGTYTCTYHGCTKRFETPAQLQKHKREGHRQISPASVPNAQSIALRNSQAGPHKCERINPSTGKPCNSIFSRPYDLTRHEDTIHNARKQKVRCHLCSEEKTFSRNDALTRHMRVVHPDVDWPGKSRRKNGKE
jgi:hypothetical protein